MKKKLMACLVAAIMILGMAAPAVSAAGDSYPYPPDYYDCLYIWMDENPEIVEEIRKDEPPLWAEYGYGSLEEMLYDWGLTDAEDYYDIVVQTRVWVYLYDDYYDIYEREYAKWVADVREIMGAARSGIAVMVNNKYISFPDAQPELSSGRTMLPIRALMEALGASVDYVSEGNTVTAKLNGVTFNFTVGESEITVIEDNISRVVQMDCNTYIKDDRTYVPVRFFSEAAGYDVLWDPDFQTAVIFDREEVTAKLNESFTVINKLLVMNSRDPSLTYKTVADISAAITSFSTLDGNLTAQTSMKATIISNGQAQNLTLSCDLGSLLSLLVERGGIYLYDDELEALSALSNVNVELIVNSDEQITYIKFPALMSVIGYDQNAWLKIDGDILSGEADVIGSDSAIYGGGSIGDMIYDSFVGYSWSGNAYDAVFFYDRMLDEAQEAEKYFGDGAFTRNGNSWSMRLDRESYEMLMYGDIPDEDAYYDYKELDVSLTITDNAGKISVSGSFKVRENTWGYGDDVRTTGTFSMSADYMSADFTVHADNSYKMDVTLRVSVSAVTQNVATAPPAGELVISY